MVFCQRSVDEQRQEEPAIANASAPKWHSAKGRFGSSVSKKDAERETEAANVRRKLRVKPDSATEGGGRRVFRIFRSASRPNVVSSGLIAFCFTTPRGETRFRSARLCRFSASGFHLSQIPSRRRACASDNVVCSYSRITGAASNAGSFHPLALCLPPRVPFNCEFGQ